MPAEDPALLDAGRFLTASAVLGLGARDGSAARSGLRALEASPARRVAWSADREDAESLAISRALRGTALGRRAAGERGWIDRIEARRGDLAARHGETAGVFAEGKQPKAERWSFIRRPGPLAKACGLVSIPPRWGRLLMRLIGELEPDRCIELGTGFGLSACYQAAALELNGRGGLTTFEGADEWAQIAREGASRLGLERFEVRVGPLSETLGSALPELAPVDFAYVDAEHTKEATIRYFEQMLPHLSPRAVLLFDDIAFDRLMWEAWEAIRDNSRVTAWAALGRMGLVRVGQG